MNCRLLVLAAALASLGCGRVDDPRGVAAPEVPYINANEVGRLTKSAEMPTLLEFCVPAGCFRCDGMRASINALARDEADRVAVRRINLNTERQLANQWGITACPTYVVVADGREIARAVFPTSADLVSAMIPHASFID